MDWDGQVAAEVAPEEEVSKRRFFLYLDSPLRMVWTFVVCILLLHTATLFLFHLCFLEFRADAADCTPAEDRRLWAEPRKKEPDDMWQVINLVVTIGFVIDMVLTFFTTYMDGEGVEVADHRKIAMRYLRNFFFLDLIACVPEQVFSHLFEAIFDSGKGAEVNQAARLLRIQQIGRLSRVLRLARIGKCATMRKHSHLGKFVHQLQKVRGVRILGLSCFLFWMNHLAACGWYLCAAMHDDPCSTWLGSRTNGGGEFMVSATSFEQWWAALYFVLTIFTSVGFGDFGVSTVGEMTYICLTMLLGAVIQSIVMGEVIQMMTVQNFAAAFVQKKLDMVSTFGQTVQLDPEVLDDLQNFVRSRAPKWLASTYDKGEMEELLEGRNLPRTLLENLPGALYEGTLHLNRFFAARRDIRAPRLPLLVGLLGKRSEYKAGQIVYAMSEYPRALFLVLCGVFAYIAEPTSKGGKHTHRTSEPGISTSGGVVPVDSEPGRSRSSSSTSELTVLAHSSISKIALEKKCPFQVFPADSYFGDVELILGRPRQTVARCESAGEALVLDKDHLARLGKDFPQYQAAWRGAALVRLQIIEAKQAELLKKVDFEGAAAQTLQKFVRRFLHARRVGLKVRTRREEWQDLRRRVDPVSPQGRRRNKERAEQEMRQKVEEVERLVADIAARLHLDATNAKN